MSEKREWLDELDEAIGKLSAAALQSSPNDDQIIADHVRDSVALLLKVRHKLREDRADKAELLAALRSAEESIVAFMAMDGDSDAGLILKQVRDTFAKVSK